MKRTIANSQGYRPLPTPFDQLEALCARLKVHLKPDHRKIFLNRTYRSAETLERALKRYKVFGDLGYGDTP